MAEGFQGPPAVDFYSMLSGLGTTIQKAQAERAKREAFATATVPGADGKIDYGRAILGLAQADPQAAALFAQRQNHEDTLAQQAITNKRAEEAAAESKRQFGLNYGLQVKKFNEGPVEQAGYREAVARKYGIDPATPEGKAFIVSGKLPESVATGGRPEVGLQPIYGVGPDGKPAIVQLSKTGEGVQTKLPENFTIAKEPIKIDNGTHYTLLDPQTRQVVGSLPKNVAEVERQKVLGDSGATAEIALPQVIATGEQLIKHVEAVKNHPGKQYSLGMLSKAPTIPGTSQADFRARLDQMGGENFLNAYQTLKGGGAITDIEGTKAQNAAVRMQTAQTTKAFDEAMDEYVGIIKQGVERAKNKAKIGKAPTAEAPTATETPKSSPNVTKSGIPWRIQ